MFIILKRFRLSSSLVFAVVLLTSILTRANVSDSIYARINMQRYVFPQEKIHVMTDKLHYMAGDTIWLRAWVVDASTHQPVDASRFVYVELQNPLYTVVTRIKLRNSNGAFSGYLPTPADQPEGTYQLSAYTMYMQSLGEAYFFKRAINITSPLATRYAINAVPRWKGNELEMALSIVNRSDGTPCKYSQMTYLVNGKERQRRGGGKGEVRVNLKGDEAESMVMLVGFDRYKKFIAIPRRADDFDLRFYPEGGYLVPNVECVTTFKSLSADGMSYSVKGRIVDDNGRIIAALSTEHDGMGKVSFIPQTGRTYRAVCSGENGTEKHFDLPQARSEATVLHLSHNGDTAVTVRAVGHNAAEAIIIAHQRGVLLGVGYKELTFECEAVPEGVVQTLLFDNQWHLLSERLFYNFGGDMVNTSISTDKPRYSNREPVHVTMLVEGDKVPRGSYAVSVTDDRSVKTDSAAAIRVNLLLQSELKGRINKPEYYFTSADEEHRSHLDMLMMTQGWRRYDIGRVMKGHMIEPEFPIEKAQVVSGRVLGEWGKKPLSDATVNLMAPRISAAELGVTNADGRFEIALPNFPDGTMCVLQAYSKQGKKQMNVEIDSQSFPQVSYTAMSPERLIESAHDENDYLAEEQARISTIDGMRNILLNEVTITAQAKKMPEDIFESLAKVHFDVEEFEKRKLTTLEEVLSRIPGIRLSRGAILSTRGRSSIIGGSQEVPVFIDGTPFRNSMGSGGGGGTEGPATVAAVGQGQAAETKTNTMTIKVPGAAAANDDVLSELNNMFPFEVIKRIDFIPPGTAAVLGAHAAQTGALWIVTKSGEELSKVHTKNYYLFTTQPLGYQKPVEFYSPKYERAEMMPGDEPDLRNTLYWNPNIEIQENGKSSFNFFTNDVERTTYTITIEGITDNGDLIHSTHSIKK